MIDERLTPIRVVLDLTGWTAEQLLRLAQFLYKQTLEATEEFKSVPKEEP